MKISSKFLKAITPYSGIAVLALGVGLVTLQTSVDSNNTNENTQHKLFPYDIASTIEDEYVNPRLEAIDKKDLIVLYAGEQIVTENINGENVLIPAEVYLSVKTDEINTILYSDDNKYISIILNDANRIFVGSFDFEKNKYVFEECCDQKTKKLSY